VRREGRIPTRRSGRTRRGGSARAPNRSAVIQRDRCSRATRATEAATRVSPSRDAR
jgi:hypothetical protein